MSLVDHAKSEFELAGWPEDDDEMQKQMCDDLLKLLETFSKQGHSGFSANYCLAYFDKLARYQTITPLTGNDGEWNEVDDGNDGIMYQNKRDPSVFKCEDGKVFWVEGKIFREPDGCTYTSSESHVEITFPWTRPEPEVIDVDEKSDESN